MIKTYKNYILLVMMNLIIVSLGFIMKTLQSRFNFPFFQFLMSSLGLYFSSYLFKKLYQLYKGISMKRRKTREFLNEVKEGALMSVFYVINSIGQIIAVLYVPLPLFLAIRRTQVVFVVLLQVFSCNLQYVQKSMIVSCLMISGATVIMICTDLENVSLLGVAITLVSNLANVIYAELSARMQNKDDIDAPITRNTLDNNIQIFNVLIQIGFTSFVITLPIFLLKNEPPKVFQSDLAIVMVLFVFYILSNFSACFIFYKVVKEIDIFIIFLSDNFKDIFGTIMSVLIYDDTKITFTLIACLGLQYLGIMIYIYYKYKHIKQNKLDQRNNMTIQQALLNEIYKSNNIIRKSQSFDIGERYIQFKNISARDTRFYSLMQS